MQRDSDRDAVKADDWSYSMLEGCRWQRMYQKNFMDEENFISTVQTINANAPTTDAHSKRNVNPVDNNLNRMMTTLLIAYLTIYLFQWKFDSINKIIHSCFRSIRDMNVLDMET